MEVNCPFCRVNAEEVVIDHDPVYARFDRCPVEQRTPANHPETTFRRLSREATKEEKLALLDVLKPWFCKNGRGIEIPARRFTAMTDLATTQIPTLHSYGDGTIFRTVAASFVMNLQIIAGDKFFWDINDFCSRISQLFIDIKAIRKHFFDNLPIFYQIFFFTIL